MAFLDKDDIQFILAHQTKNKTGRLHMFTDYAKNYPNLFKISAADTQKEIECYYVEEIFRHEAYHYQSYKAQANFWDNFPDKLKGKMFVPEGTLFLLTSLYKTSSDVGKGSQFLNYIFHKYPRYKNDVINTIINADTNYFGRKPLIYLLSTITHQKNDTNFDWLIQATEKLKNACAGEYKKQFSKDISKSSLNFNELGLSVWRKFMTLDVELRDKVIDNLTEANNNSIKLQSWKKENIKDNNYEDKPDFEIKNDTKEIQIENKFELNLQNALLKFPSNFPINKEAIFQIILNYTRVKEEEKIKEFTDLHRMKYDNLTFDSGVRQHSDGILTIYNNFTFKNGKDKSNTQEMLDLNDQFVEKTKEIVIDLIKEHLTLLRKPGLRGSIPPNMKSPTEIYKFMQEYKNITDLQEAININMQKVNSNLADDEPLSLGGIHFKI